MINVHSLSMQAHVQNAVLAGGVAVGTTANMLIHPWGAILLGTLAGIISVCGFYYVQVIKSLLLLKPKVII